MNNLLVKLVPGTTSEEVSPILKACMDVARANGWNLILHDGGAEFTVPLMKNPKVVSLRRDFTPDTAA